MANELPELTISIFPRGDAIWRVDWFGPLNYPDRSARSAQPSVKVHLSQIADPARVTDSAWLLAPEATRADSRRVCDVSVGTTMLLRIGDLWNRQALFAKPQYELEEFRDIEINWETVSVVKAGSSFDDGTFVISSREHPWHRGNTHSYCVKVDLGGGRLLVVPAQEMIRFYFGSSSGLLSRLFTTGVSKQDLFTASDLDRARVATLTLASGIVRASAHDVARIAFSEAGWRAAQLVSNSCLRASARKDAIYPQGVFPFEGRTTLKAKGKWLTRQGQDRQTFLVYELRSCSHPFPYRVLQYRLVESPISEVSRKGPGKENSAARSAASVSKPKSLRLDERDASKALTPGTVSLPRTVRFPDLVGKPTFCEELVEAERPPSSGGGRSTAAVDAAAVGDAESYERVRPLSLVEARNRVPESPAPLFLRPLLVALDEVEGTVTLLTASEDDGWSLPVGLRADEDHLVDEGLFEDGRQRRVCIFRLTSGDLDCLLAAVEATPAIFLIQNAGIQVGTDIADCMRRMVESVQARNTERLLPHYSSLPEVTSEELLDWFTSWIGTPTRDPAVFAPASGPDLAPIT